MSFFALLNCGISMLISILTRVQNRRITNLKNDYIFLKMFFLKPDFQGESLLRANHLFYILTI